MTYKTPSESIVATTRIYELTLSTDQTVDSGDVIKFDTLRQTSAGGGVSNNSTTGAITLDSNHRYFLQCSIDVTRASTSNSIRVAFFDSDSDSELTVSDGAYDAAWIYHASSVITAQPNPTLQAEYIPSGVPVSPIKLKVFDVGNSSTLNTNFSLIIVETVL